MPKDNRFFDDFAKLASGAAGGMLDMKRELETLVMDKVEKMLGRMHLVRREEFEVMRSMLEQSRLKQEQIEKKLTELEKLLDSQGSKEKPSTRLSKK